ncbi:MAG TPA: hypothetical protein VFZ87_07765, partial [Gemmatimonadales bacterium]
MFTIAGLALVTTLATGDLVAGMPAVSADTACPHRNVPLEGRKSPLDSLTFSVAGKQVKVCYGRPSSRGRVMLGGENVP